MLSCPKCKSYSSSEEYKEGISLCPECNIELEEDVEVKPPFVPYVKLSDKYNNVKSSGYSLLITGFVGVIFLILKTIGIIPLELETHSNIMFYIVMGTVFTLFIMFGSLSLKSASQLKEQVAEEEEFIQFLNNWLSESFTADIIDQNIGDETLEEKKYFIRFEFIRKSISEKYPDISDSFLEYIAEEFYQKLYE